LDRGARVFVAGGTELRCPYPPDRVRRDRPDAHAAESEDRGRAGHDVVDFARGIDPPTWRVGETVARRIDPQPFERMLTGRSKSNEVCRRPAAAEGPLP